MAWTRLPPLSSLRAFAAYAETGNVNAAGAALNVSHAAISQQLRALESHMGLTLLNRDGRRMTLTPEGALLAHALQEGFGQIAAAVEALTGAEADRPLQVSTTPTFAAAWLMPRLARFRAQHPDIDLMIDPSAEIRPLTPGGYDVALRYGNGDWPGLDADLIVRSPVVIVAAPELIGTRHITSPADLADFHWLQELGTNETTAWFTAQDITPPRRGMTSLPGNLMIEAARQGQGIAILARIFAAPDIAAGRLRLLFQTNDTEGYWCVTRPGIPRPPLRAFLAWLKSEARQSDTAQT